MVLTGIHPHLPDMSGLKERNQPRVSTPGQSLRPERTCLLVMLTRGPIDRIPRAFPGYA